MTPDEIRQRPSPEAQCTAKHAGGWRCMRLSGHEWPHVDAYGVEFPEARPLSAGNLCPDHGDDGEMLMLICGRCENAIAREYKAERDALQGQLDALGEMVQQFWSRHGPALSYCDCGRIGECVHCRLRAALAATPAAERPTDPTSTEGR